MKKILSSIVLAAFASFILCTAVQAGDCKKGKCDKEEESKKEEKK